jgi:hypothetical protein
LREFASVGKAAYGRIDPIREFASVGKVALGCCLDDQARRTRSSSDERGRKTAA